MTLAPQISEALVKKIVSRVLDAEGAGPASVSVTFLTGQQMRGLNRRTLGKDRATDVIAFPLNHPEVVVGDIYICPSVAVRNARERGEDQGRELMRLTVHGTLHVLGYDHPEGAGRETSRMWSIQERYVASLGGDS